ncbi:microcephalin isoform X2 [Nematostella vectensis]|uniref:microcephalin isoform X2 n=1 Tax=Nematostella vectensis TaxID=45351 RepID=UPI0020776CB7|nr:microcephalin isoform X2 [Nematostella vectensis]
MNRGKSSLKLNNGSRNAKKKNISVTIGKTSYCGSPEQHKDRSLYRAVLKDSATKHGAAPNTLLAPSTRPFRTATSRKNSDEFEFRCSFDSDEENSPEIEIPPTQPVTEEQILTGVVAFIDVRSNTENRFDGISKQMELLGATVVRKFIPEVTHVIFKDGKKATREKALKKGIHLVTVLWVESCRETGKRVAEELFPVIAQDELSTPLLMGKLKRTKSMQPKSFEEDVKNSAEKEKRRRRLTGKRNSPATTSLDEIFGVEGVTSLSPLLLGSPLIAGVIPDSPPMRTPIAEEASDVEDGSPAVDPTIKRLKFDDSSNNETSEPKGLGTNETKGSRRSTRNPNQSPAETARTPITKKTPADMLQTGSGPQKKRKRGNVPQHLDASESDSNISVAKKPKNAVKDLIITPVLDEENAAKNTRGSGKRGRAKSVGGAAKTGEFLETPGHQDDQEIEHAGGRAKKLKLARGRGRPRAKSTATTGTEVEFANKEMTARNIEANNVGSSSLENLEPRDNRNERNSGRATGRVTGLDSELDVYGEDSASDSGVSVSERESRMKKGGTENKLPERKKKFNKTASLVGQKPHSAAGEDHWSGMEWEEGGAMEKGEAVEKTLTKLSNPGFTQSMKTAMQSVNDFEEKETVETGVNKRGLDRKQVGKESKGKEVQKKKITKQDNDHEVGGTVDIGGDSAKILNTRIAKTKREPKQTRKKKTPVSCTEDETPEIEYGGDVSRTTDYTASSSDEHTVSTEDEGRSDRVRKGLKTRRAKALRKTKESTTSRTKPRRSMVLTSMHFGEQDIVVSVVRKLGGFYIADKAGANTTHVIAGSPRRTLNVLRAIAQGCWLVSPEWVMKSLEAGYWVDEEPYELADDFPAAQLSRLERVSSGPCFRQELFKEMEPIFVAEDTSPPRDELIHLITLCGGNVCTSIRSAGLCVGKVNRRIDTSNVTEAWVLDSITEHSVLSFCTYALNSPARSRREESPTY